MKTLTLLLAFSVFAATAQTIRIADNNPNRPTGANIYATIQAAVDAAVAGDVVFVQPSLTNYGDVTINKQITLRGIGFNTGKDFAYSSLVNNIALTNRSDNTSNASGTVIEGLQANDIYPGTRTGAFTYNLSDVRISNCRVNRFYRDTGAGNYQPMQNLIINGNHISIIMFSLTNISQALIYGNLFSGGFFFCGGAHQAIQFANGTVTNVIVANNIFNQTAAIGFSNSLSISGATISNNNFIGGTDNVNSRFVRDVTGPNCQPSTLYDVTISNNLFYGYAPNSNSSGSFERNGFGYNLTFGTSNNNLPPVGTGAGNSNSGGNKVNLDPLFINAPYGGAYSGALNYNLQPSSPAKNAGSDGTDIGITGGAYPITSGNINLRPTAAPVIMTFTPQVLVPQNQPVKANIKAKAN